MEFVKPMLCRQVEDIEKLPKGNYLFQEKLDGTRTILKFKEELKPDFPKVLVIQNRRFDNLQFRYPEFDGEVFHNALRKDCGVLSIILDGEIVGSSGKFNDILERDTLTNGFLIKVRAKERPLTYYAFDLLEVNGVNYRDLPYERRVIALKRFVQGNDRIKILPTHEKPPSMVGKEGIIAKRKDSKYYEGVRSPMWWKIKNWERIKAQITGWRYGDRGKKVVLITQFGDVSCPSMELQDYYLKEKPKVAIVRHLSFKQKGGCWRQPVLEGFE